MTFKITQGLARKYQWYRLYQWSWYYHDIFKRKYHDIIENINPFFITFLLLFAMEKQVPCTATACISSSLSGSGTDHGVHQQQAYHCGEMEAQRNKFLSSKKAKTYFAFTWRWHYWRKRHWFIWLWDKQQGSKRWFLSFWFFYGFLDIVVFFV